MADFTAAAQPSDADARRAEFDLGGGAQFWAYLSPSHDTVAHVTSWSVQIEQQDGSWSGSITSEDPQAILQAPDRSGTFDVTVTASGPRISEMALDPLPDSKPDVGCNSDCAAMVGIVATEDGTGAMYWTTGDALCAHDADADA
jgi:hypothetical protein